MEDRRVSKDHPEKEDFAVLLPASKAQGQMDILRV